jgi:HK97 family phage prohead protease
VEHVVGYAAVWDVSYRQLGLQEYVERGAFRHSLAFGWPIEAWIDHDANRSFASTRLQSLELAEDDWGLVVKARLPLVIPDAQLLADTLRQRVVPMSWRAADKRIERDGERRILGLSLLDEVSFCLGERPANPATCSFLLSSLRGRDPAAILKHALANIDPSKPEFAHAIAKAKLIQRFVNPSR